MTTAQCRLASKTLGPSVAAVFHDIVTLQYQHNVALLSEHLIHDLLRLEQELCDLKWPRTPLAPSHLQHTDVETFSSSLLSVFRLVCSCC